MKRLILTIIFFQTIHFADAQLSSDNWLFTSRTFSSVNLGDLDISGHQLTVEAVINRTAPWAGGNEFAGDVVSKHDNPINVNYLLRPNGAEITTYGRNGTTVYTATPKICPIQLNRTYHIAMTYDGTTLKFYRNGFLMCSAPASGELFQNNLEARIGCYSAQVLNEQFVGYINEERIWNMARTQSQIQTYMNTSLPHPAKQAGLQAYYSFDNLTNKQGNSNRNGSVRGSAKVNATNPDLTLSTDSCGINKMPPSPATYMVQNSWNLKGNKISDGSNFLGTISNNDINIKTSSVSRGVITAKGYLGWNTMKPTTLFHIKSPGFSKTVPSGIRLEHLPAGTGSALVVDENGYLFKSKAAANNSLAFLVCSNENDKRNIEPVQNPLQIIDSLEGRTYYLHEKEQNITGAGSYRQYGLVAQEVQKVMPEAVTADKNGNYAINYGFVIPVLIEGQKELLKLYKEVKAKNEKLEAELKQLNDKISQQRLKPF